MNRPRRILTVCIGNICRSPLAAAVLAQRGGADVEVRSAGLCDKWAGGPAHPRGPVGRSVRQVGRRARPPADGRRRGGTGLRPGRPQCRPGHRGVPDLGRFRPRYGH
ncbi:arsenate reductase/protein-tyrosine-phosphatase family protein [Streptomyces goshikiensis]